MRRALSLAAGGVNRMLRPLGAELVRRGEREPGRGTIEGALRQLQNRGLAPRTVLDVGAAYGDWSHTCARFWPSARYVLVEPLAEYRPFLETRVRQLGVAVHVETAVGASAGEVELHVHPDLVGTSTRAEREESGGERRVVPITRIDNLVAETASEAPFLLKLDVQGAELDAIRGAEAALARSDALVLEGLFFEFYVGGPQIADLIAGLRERGFAVYDVVDLAYRPLDGALAQADLVFVRADGPLRSDHRYATQEQRRALDQAFRGQHAARRR